MSTGDHLARRQSWNDHIGLTRTWSCMIVHQATVRSFLFVHSAMINIEDGLFGSGTIRLTRRVVLNRRRIRSLLFKNHLQHTRQSKWIIMGVETQIEITKQVAQEEVFAYVEYEYTDDAGKTTLWKRKSRMVRLIVHAAKDSLLSSSRHWGYNRCIFWWGSMELCNQRASWFINTPYFHTRWWDGLLVHDQKKKTAISQRVETKSRLSDY